MGEKGYPPRGDLKIDFDSEWYFDDRQVAALFDMMMQDKIDIDLAEKLYLAVEEKLAPILSKTHADLTPEENEKANTLNNLANSLYLYKENLQRNLSKDVIDLGDQEH